MASGTGRTKATEAEFDAAWRAHRAYLVNLAYGMLRDVGAAEDAVQEAFARLADADYPAIAELRAWLTVVTSRICLDQIGSARARRERPQDVSTLEWAGTPTAAPAVDPADRVTLDDDVRAAMLVVLDRLTPAERVVFVLHDVFSTPFEQIAETVGRSAATCRQLARRARQKVQQGGVPTSGAADLRQRQVVDRFIEACATGDVAALVLLLDPDAWGTADMGPQDPRSGVVNRGRDRVARTLLFWFGRNSTLVTDPARDEREILAFDDREFTAVIRLDVVGDLIRSVSVTVDPARAR
ncbi:MAG: polymerase sigma-70 factor, subfamily [Pseudonocardiales bacterium]|nr:polymerase sigma-70 factor, subfamily [Pseudonocardiales bacterium]